MTNPHAPSGVTYDEAKVDALLQQLKDKYQATGQNVESYLEGLLYQDYLNYWDYIHTDALLALQIPRTQFPDEEIFIVYHQISELNFKMILSELSQIGFGKTMEEAELEKRVNRINRYMDLLVNSFDVMSDGMDPQQFLKFRMALLPASGFQSAQFRMIEIASTDFQNLIPPTVREQMTPETTIDEMYELAYWKQGARELKTGEKILTLKRFEEKYSEQLAKMIGQYADANLRRRYRDITGSNPGEGLRNALREYDTLINVKWRLVHFRSAMRYLHKTRVAPTGRNTCRRASSATSSSPNCGAKRRKSRGVGAPRHHSRVPHV